jgi:hypothetical protein
VRGTLVADDITSGTLNCSLLSVTNLSASSITTGTLNCANITVSNLSASSITVGTLNVARLSAGSITGYYINSSGSGVGAGNINPGVIGPTHIDYLSASDITTGTLNCSLLTVSNLSASSITTGSLSASRISGGTANFGNFSCSNFSADYIVAGTLNVGTLIASGTIVQTHLENFATFDTWYGHYSGTASMSGYWTTYIESAGLNASYSRTYICTVNMTVQLAPSSNGYVILLGNGATKSTCVVANGDTASSHYETVSMTAIISGVSTCGWSLIGLCDSGSIDVHQADMVCLVLEK